MRKGLREFWRRLGRVEKAFLLLVAIYVLLRVSGVSPDGQILTALAALIVGIACLVRLGSRMMRKAIWRLRNRLIVAYVFIAVVPIALILTLAYAAGWTLVGQVAAYFVRTALADRERTLLRQTEFLVPGGLGDAVPGGRGGAPAPGGAGAPGGGGYPGAGQGPGSARGFVPAGRGRPGGNPTFGPFAGPRTAGAGTAADAQSYLTFMVNNLAGRFPGSEVLVTGREEIRHPADSTLTRHPPAEWGRASGLVFRQEGDARRLYMWAHVVGTGPEGGVATVLCPVTSDVLAHLDRRLNVVSIQQLPGEGSETYVPLSREARVPAPRNALDLSVDGIFPLQISSWDSPTDQTTALLVVTARMSTVLGIIFEQRAGQRITLNDMAQAVFITIIALFLFIEIASLRAGVKLTRSITGAVHELYQGTQRVKEGDFTYRIPVKGNDQLAELGSSFNTMTENLGSLIVVAKEKERLQSELEIAREVQNQLFPRDVPSSKTLELKGVCKPARVVSGDYYDFMAMAGSELAFAIGDVAGKGISAALLMATIQSTMRTQLSATNGSTPMHFSAARLVAQLNRQLFANTTPEKYATFFFAIYDEARCALTYTNAGHLPPILVRSGAFTNLDPTGTVVGAFPFAKYEERTVELENGDIVVAYTDGIVEPENPYGEMFGEHRMKDLILRYAYAGSSEIIARIMEAVVQWTGSSELQDDMTMVVVRRI
jgi:sigma-B regulation protein RsbU (phosphoserine phosphatase)